MNVLINCYAEDRKKEKRKKSQTLNLQFFLYRKEEVRIKRDITMKLG